MSSFGQRRRREQQQQQQPSRRRRQQVGRRRQQPHCGGRQRQGRPLVVPFRHAMPLLVPLILPLLVFVVRSFRVVDFVPTATAFRISSTPPTAATPSSSRRRRISFADTPTAAAATTTTRLYSAGKNNENDPSNGSSGTDTKKSALLEEGLRQKLLSETIAPWRSLRLYFYGGLGVGAFVGGLITLTGVLAALNGNRPDLDLPTEYQNLAIDFGAVLAFALLAKWDLRKQAELDATVQERMERTKSQRKVVRAMRERERVLGTLRLSVRVNADGDTREASVRELQAGARQHVILVVGPKKACRDALVGANLLKMDFAMSNVLVVPYETDLDPSERAAQQSPKGFGDGRPAYERQPYVARPAPSDAGAWEQYVRDEIRDAVAQNGPQIQEEGIAVVVANTSKVLRRGVGKVPWRQMVEELDAASKAAA